MDVSDVQLHGLLALPLYRPYVARTMEEVTADQAKEIQPSLAADAPSDEAPNDAPSSSAPQEKKKTITPPEKDVPPDLCLHLFPPPLKLSLLRRSLSPSRTHKLWATIFEGS